MGDPIEIVAYGSALLEDCTSLFADAFNVEPWNDH
jgi:hypothetical protein